VRIRILSVALSAAVVVLALPREGAPTTLTATFAPIRMAARPGEVLTTAYQLKIEDGEPPANFKVSVQDWWRSEDGQHSFYAAAGSLSRSCGPWISASPGESTRAGGETLQVRLTIAVPEAVKPGGYWCALTVDEQLDPLATTPAAVGMRFLASVSTGIYVNVNPIERGVDILSVDIVGDNAVMKLSNTGNAPVSVEGRYEFVKPGETRPYATVELPRNVLLTEPIPTGTFAAPLPSPADLPSGTYVVRLLLDIGLDHYIGVQRQIEINRAIRPDPPVK